QRMPDLYRPDAKDLAAFNADGFVLVDQLIDPAKIARLHAAFEDLFAGKFATGVRPDEVNWQQGESDPTLTRQICNGWKASRELARVVLDESIARAIGTFTGWSGVRVMIDNVIWKPPATRSLGFHQDNAFLGWFAPGEICTCWIALDDTTREGGTIEFARASHRWALDEPEGEFHAPDDYRQPLRNAALRAGKEPDICYVEVKAGGGSFHHGRTWHGSGANSSHVPRRSLVLHAMPAEVEYRPENFQQGIGPIYSRYKRLGDNTLDENYFPILWRDDGYRTPVIDRYLDQSKSG
ncbi:MAG: phytanoyl-CoA dioxygenase family protein, partial [Gammaproteobacteria bacterium]|nr:phytanoyl-CoA dioxygenase family protein [Gammaproteobacteria bacterium]